MTKLCNSCAHYGPVMAYSDRAMQATYARCKLTLQPSMVDPILDRLNGQYCDVERAAKSQGRCGPEGRFWEPAHGTIAHDPYEAEHGRCECLECVQERAEMAELNAGGMLTRYQAE